MSSVLCLFFVFFQTCQTGLTDVNNNGYRNGINRTSIEIATPDEIMLEIHRINKYQQKADKMYSDKIQEIIRDLWPDTHKLYFILCLSQ